MRVHRIISGAAVAVAITIVAGCAALPPEEGEAKQERVYRTGSNLPQKDRGSGVVILNPTAVQQGLSRSVGSGKAPGG